LSYVVWRYYSHAKKTGKNRSYVKIFSYALSKLQHCHRLVKKRFVKKEKYVVFIHPVLARCSRQGSVSTTISSPRWSLILHRPMYPCPGASVLWSTSRCLPRCSWLCSVPQQLLLRPANCTFGSLRIVLESQLSRHLDIPGSSPRMSQSIFLHLKKRTIRIRTSSNAILSCRGSMNFGNILFNKSHENICCKC
jgi:hypothetical protein